MGILSDICRNQGIVDEHLSSEVAQKICGDLTKGDSRGKAYSMQMQYEGEDLKFIFYDETAPTWEKRALVAHELGHILLGHLTGHTPLSPEQSVPEAQIFGVMFTALMIFAEYGGFHMAT